MRVEHSFKTFVLDQLRLLGPIECRRMFGSFGLYHEGRFFAILWQDRLFFKIDEQSRAEYLRYGMGSFQPNQKQVLKSYFEVPLEIVEDDEQLVLWARRALAAADR